MQPQSRTDDDDGTAGVIDPLTQQVLTEAALLTLDHVSQRFQWPLVRSGNRSPPTTIIEQSIDRFLQHTLFVADDDVWRIQVQ